MLTLSPGSITIKTYTQDGEYQPDQPRLTTGEAALFVCHTEEDPTGRVSHYTWRCDGGPCDGMAGVLAVKQNELLVVLQNTNQRYSCEVSDGNITQQGSVDMPARGQSCSVITWAIIETILMYSF